MRGFNSTFFYCLVPSALFCAVALSRSWVPIHDAFQITNITHFVFNEAVTHHAIPLWYPYINYGVEANWYLAFTIGPSFATVLQIARLLGRGDLLQYFYVAFFLDELVLVVGTYLLARLLFRRRLTIVFVSAAMTGSTLWLAQPWFNFHLYYFVPLGVYFALTGIARRELWRIFAGGLALLVSEFGSLPYFVVLHGLMYLVFVAGAWWAYRFDIRDALRRAGVRDMLTLGACLVAGATYLMLVTYGVSHVSYDVGRTSSSTASATGFLTYGSGIGFSKFGELLTGVSWDIDATVYAGVLVTACALFGLLWAPQRSMVPFLAVAVVFGLFSLGGSSFIAPLAYLIPGVAYYRHIGLVAPLIKVMLIVLSGYGFEAVLQVGDRVDRNPQDLARRAYLILASILIVLFLSALVLVALAATSLIWWGRNYVFSQLSDATSGFGGIQALLNRWTFVVLVYLGAIAALIAPAIRIRPAAVVVGSLLVLIQVVDVYSYRMFQFQHHMVSVGADYRRLLDFSSRPFATQRTRDPMSNAAFRVVAAHFGPPVKPNWYSQCVRVEEMHCYYDDADEPAGVFYNTIEPFVGFDPCRSIFRVDYWLPGVDRFYRAVTGMPLNDLAVLPDGYDERAIYFPVDDKRVEKAIGCEFPKLQVFSSVTVVGNEQKTARFMYDPAYSGDLLLASAEDYAAYLGRRRAPSSAGDSSIRLDTRPDASTRALGQVRVLSATANEVVVAATAPRRANNYWLYYADAWHPFWHVQVNGKEVPLLRANFGFKAVEIPAGPSVVKFMYKSRTLLDVVVLAQGLSVAAMVAVILFTGRLLLYP